MGIVHLFKLLYNVSMATAAYIRVSTDGQESGHGLDVQRNNIVAYAAVHGLTIDEWHQDVESGAVEDRPGLTALREGVRSGRIDTVLVYRLDRLAREALLSEMLYRELSQRARVVSVSEAIGEGLTGDLMRRILAAFADYERAVIALRTSTGRREAVRRRGTFSGGPGVYGYRPVGRRGNPGAGRLAVSDREAEAVRLVFELRAQGRTLLEIAQRLNDGGYTTMTGRPFTHVQVLRILRREAFYRAEGVLNRSIEAETVAHEPILAGVGR